MFWLTRGILTDLLLMEILCGGISQGLSGFMNILEVKYGGTELTINYGGMTPINYGKCLYIGFPTSNMAPFLKEKHGLSTEALLY